MMWVECSQCRQPGPFKFHLLYMLFTVNSMNQCVCSWFFEAAILCELGQGLTETCEMNKRSVIKFFKKIICGEYKYSLL